MKQAFATIPFLRILIPFVSGILFEQALSFKIPLFFILILLVIVVVIYLFSKQQKGLKTIYMVLADVILFSCAVNLTYEKEPTHQKLFYGNQQGSDSLVTLIASVDDIPVEKERFVKCKMKISSIKHGNLFELATGNAIVYVRKNKTKKPLHINERILLRAPPLPIPLPKNPEEFNYKQYLNNRQIYHTFFLDSNQYVSFDTVANETGIWAFGLRCKQHALNNLKNSGLNTEAYSICAALLTGYDDDIDNSIMQSFAHSGTLHVLSVSGLHTGLIYLVLNFFLNSIDRKRKHKAIRMVVVTILLWTFALFTGFSAPVLRAVIMFNLLGVGNAFLNRRRQSQMNLLLVSAFLLLCVNPFFIKDLGFLLSYFAMAGLLFYQTKLAAYLEPNNRVLQYIWQSICASLAATISTLPITLYFFKQFPLWFLVCNIVVVPITFLILMLSLLLVLNLTFFAPLINGLVYGTIQFIELFNKQSFGYLDMIDIDTWDMLFLTFTIVFSTLFWFKKSFYTVCLLVLTIIVWQFSSLIGSYESKSKSILTVYSLKNEAGVSVKNKNHVYLSSISEKNYNYSVKPQLISFNYPKIIKDNFNYIQTSNSGVFLLKVPGFIPSEHLRDITMLVVSNNVMVNETLLKKFTFLKSMVFDGSNNKRQLKKGAELCRKFGLQFYETKHHPALLVY